MIHYRVFQNFVKIGESRLIKFLTWEMTGWKPHLRNHVIHVTLSMIPVTSRSFGAFRLQKIFKIPVRKILFMCENKNFRPAAVWKKLSRCIVFIRVLFHSDSKNILRKFDHSEVQPISFVLCRHRLQRAVWKCGL